MIGLREIEATQQTIRELRAAGEVERAAAVTAVLEAATVSLAARRDDGPRPFLTTGEVARALGVTIQTVKNWAAAGRLPMVRMGGRNYVRREDLLAYLDTLRSRSRTSGPFDGPGVDDARVRSALPAELVARIDRYHDQIERAEPLGASEQAELDRLQNTANQTVVDRVAEARRRGR